MKERKTPQGFDLIVFEDKYGVRCSLQKTSCWVAEDAIWFGSDAVNTKMYLTQKQVKELLPYLQRFVETGKLCMG